MSSAAVEKYLQKVKLLLSRDREQTNHISYLSNHPIGGLCEGLCVDKCELCHNSSCASISLTAEVVVYLPGAP